MSSAPAQLQNSIHMRSSARSHGWARRWGWFKRNTRVITMTCCQCKLRAVTAYVVPITAHQGMISSLLAPSGEPADIVAKDYGLQTIGTVASPRHMHLFSSSSRCLGSCYENISLLPAQQKAPCSPACSRGCTHCPCCSAALEQPCPGAAQPWGRLHQLPVEAQTRPGARKGSFPVSGGQVLAGWLPGMSVFLQSRSCTSNCGNFHVVLAALDMTWQVTRSVARCS